MRNQFDVIQIADSRQNDDTVSAYENIDFNSVKIRISDLRYDDDPFFVTITGNNYDVTLSVDTLAKCIVLARTFCKKFDSSVEKLTQSVEIVQERPIRQHELSIVNKKTNVEICFTEEHVVSAISNASEPREIFIQTEDGYTVILPLVMLTQIAAAIYNQHKCWNCLKKAVRCWSKFVLNSIDLLYIYEKFDGEITLTKIAKCAACGQDCESSCILDN